MARLIVRNAGYELKNLIDLSFSGIPKDSVARHLSIDRVEICGTPTELGITTFDCLAGNYEYPVITFPSTFTKPDLCIPAVDQDQVKVPVYVQVKNHQQPLTPYKFMEAIQSLQPKYFFKNAPDQRAEFERLISKNFYDRYVRIVTSYSGFNSTVIEHVKKYNSMFGKSQPIVLFHPPKEKLGAQLWGVLHRSQKIPKGKKETPFNESLLIVEYSLNKSEITSPKAPKTKEQPTINSFFISKKQKTENHVQSMEMD